MKDLKKYLVLCLCLILPMSGFAEEEEAPYKRKYDTILQMLKANNLAHKDKSFLYLFIHPSYNVFDYTTSRDFQRSSIVEDGMWGYDLNSVGHVQFAWYCNTSNDLYSGATGYTGEEDDQVSTMIDQGWGLTAMLSDFKDGNFEPEYYVTEDLETKWHNEAGFFWMAVEVDKNECFNSQFFLEDYIQKAPPVFSFTKNPDKFEGAVCSSLAASFFRNSETEYQSMIDATYRTVRIHESVLGKVSGSELPEAVGLPEFASSLPEKKVNKVNLILRNIPFNPKRNYQNFEFYDPELMAFMITRLEAEYIPGKSQMISRKIMRLNERENFSRSSTRYRGKGSQFSNKYYPVTRKTDRFYQGVYDAVKSFKRKNKNIKVSRKVLEGQAGIIIERTEGR